MILLCLTWNQLSWNLFLPADLVRLEQRTEEPFLLLDLQKMMVMMVVMMMVVMMATMMSTKQQHQDPYHFEPSSTLLLAHRMLSLSKKRPKNNFWSKSG